MGDQGSRSGTTACSVGDDAVSLRGTATEISNDACFSSHNYSATPTLGPQLIFAVRLLITGWVDRFCPPPSAVSFHHAPSTNSPTAKVTQTFHLGELIIFVYHQQVQAGERVTSIRQSNR